MDIDLQAIEAFASQAHAGQMYGQAEAYINHPRRVAARLSNPLHKAIALLHDVVEDTGVSLAEIEARFGQKIAAGVDAMTRREGEQYHRDYLPRLAQSPDARRVKIEDLKENIHYAEHVNREYAGLIPRYRKALAFLESFSAPGK